MFGRRNRKAEEEAAREADRRALFAELAKRPDTICPFLGLADARTKYHEGATDKHRCYAFGDPAELSSEQQHKVCLQRGYGNCPRYLRGVLVIPTEELEALRRPQPMAPRPQRTPVPPPQVAARGGGGGRRSLIAVGLVLLLAAGGGAAAFVALNGGLGVAQETPTPTGGGSVVGSVQPSETSAATATPTPEPTPIVLPSSSEGEFPVLPAPGPNDVATGFAVFVKAGEYPVVRMGDGGKIGRPATTIFDRVSAAPVERFQRRGAFYWRTLLGEYTGLAYSRSLSEDFRIYETFRAPNGDTTFRRLREDELTP